MTPEEEIYENAARVIENCGPLSGLGASFGYNRESVVWLDGYIERLRASGEVSSKEQITNLSVAFGCFLGECIRAGHGGEWRQHELAWGVFFPDGQGAFPFSKVRKQLEDGHADGDSILSFYDILPRLLAGELDVESEEPQREQKSIWKRWFGR
jgi:hypothetical protein